MPECKALMTTADEKAISCFELSKLKRQNTNLQLCDIMGACKKLFKIKSRLQNWSGYPEGRVTNILSIVVVQGKHIALGKHK